VLTLSVLSSSSSTISRMISSPNRHTTSLKSRHSRCNSGLKGR
jgi:hypothetical protein